MAADRACEAARRGSKGRRRLAFMLTGILGLSVGPVCAQSPLSAIDWLSNTIGATTIDPAGPAPTEPETDSRNVLPDAGAGRPALPTIATSVLGPASPEATGLFPASDAGLAPGFWGRIDRAQAIAMVGAPRRFPLPALGDLFRAILLSELTPPVGSDQMPLLFLARIDRLLAIGALEEAAALIQQAPPDVAARPEVFRRAFDAALLLGTENDGCSQIERAAELAPTLPVRIFCFVRLNDWQAAQLTLDIAHTLGQVEEGQATLLGRFLDPSLSDEPTAEPALPPDQPVTPLLWRILEAIGEPVPTTSLPLAFAHADLEANAGWRSRIAAAERLAREGAIAPEVLFALYAEARPAASGGLWDRADLVRQLEGALAAEDRAAAEALLPELWSEIQGAALEVAFARQYAEALTTLMAAPKGATPSLDAPPTEGWAIENGRIGPKIGAGAGDPADPEGASPDQEAPAQLAGPVASPAEVAALTIALLGPAPEVAAARLPLASDPRLRFVQALMLGDPAAATAPDAITRAIALAFRSPAPVALLTPAQRTSLREGRAAEALFQAMDRLAAAAAGDARGLVDAFALMRVVGFEGIARHAAAQLVLLDRRG